ncbi:MAG: hypothetical protein IT292_04130 [Deltaproteobacteria bacterium]|nr:hypothetical protein [Deltaproteobacteria bacterium]
MKTINKTLVILLIIIGSSFLTSDTFSQTTEARPNIEDKMRTGQFTKVTKTTEGADPFSTHYDFVTDDIKIEGKEVNDPILTFDGWASAYDGYLGSTLLLKKSNVAANNQYPELRSGGQETNWEKSPTSLGALTLGVDDEVRKAQMPVFQSVRSMRKDFTENVTSDQDFRQLYTTLRGTTILTLSFADKTVAAALATTQQQADDNTSIHLLKQINWATKELTDPQRKQLFSDVDEKVEACMLSQAAYGPQSKELENFKKRVKAEEMQTNPICKKKCGTFPTASGNNDQKGTKGLYEFCVCCAETLTSVNTGVLDVNKEGVWSLVDRIFMGTSKPEANSINGQAANGEELLVPDAALVAKELYGDIAFIIESSSGNGEPGQADEQSPVPLQFKYIPPLLSVSQYIAILRDGKNAPTGGGENFAPGDENGRIRWGGICPAVIDILKNWPPTEDKMAKLRELWPDASLGKILKAADIESWFVFSPVKPPVPQNWKPTGQMLKFVNSFCDASAVAALKKIHENTKAIIEDHLMLNRVMDEQQKAEMRNMIARFERKFRQADAEIAAQYLVEEQLQLAATRDARVMESQNANNAFTAQNGREQAQSTLGGVAEGMNPMNNN